MLIPNVHEGRCILIETKLNNANKYNKCMHKILYLTKLLCKDGTCIWFKCCTSKMSICPSQVKEEKAVVYLPWLLLRMRGVWGCEEMQRFATCFWWGSEPNKGRGLAQIHHTQNKTCSGVRRLTEKSRWGGFTYHFSFIWFYGAALM